MPDFKTQLSLQDIKDRILSSFVSLVTRQIALRAIGFVSINIILAKVLPIETLGIFNIATAIVTFFAFFSDVGLAASLIQKKDEVTPSDIKTTFTIQSFLVGILSLIIVISAPLLGEFYQLNNEGIWLVRVLGISFFLSSLKVIPAVMLERELKFKPLVTVEVVEAVVFNILLIACSLLHFGIWSFSIAALARGVTGTVLIYILAPVKIGLGIEKSSAKKLLSFGIPYQSNSLLALLKDRLVPLVIAKMIGPTGVGLVTWSQSVAFLPLEIMNIVIRITFPAFSRLQHDTKALSSAVEKSLFVTSLIVYPLLFGIGAILPFVVLYVVSSKWQPAVASFYLFAFSYFWAVISTTFTNTLNAIGYVKTTLKLMLLWTILTWIITPILVVRYGFIGVSLASFAISFTSLITIILIKRVLNIRVINAICLPTGASLLMSIVVYTFSHFFVRSSVSLGLAIILGIIVYLLIILAFGKKRLIEDLRSLRGA